MMTTTSRMLSADNVKKMVREVTEAKLSPTEAQTIRPEVQRLIEELDRVAQPNGRFVPDISHAPEYWFVE